MVFKHASSSLSSAEVQPEETLAVCLKNYRLPEHPFAWRQYVKRTIADLAKKQRRTARPDGFTHDASIESIAATQGISEGQLYRMIRKGKVVAVRTDAGEYITIEQKEINRLSSLLKEKQLRKNVIAAYAKKPWD